MVITRLWFGCWLSPKPRAYTSCTSGKQYNFEKTRLSGTLLSPQGVSQIGFWGSWPFLFVFVLWLTQFHHAGLPQAQSNQQNGFWIGTIAMLSSKANESFLSVNSLFQVYCYSYRTVSLISVPSLLSDQPVPSLALPHCRRVNETPYTSVFACLWRSFVS